MDDERMTGSLRPVVARALLEAKSRGSATVEAEHLLLALASDRRSSAAVILEGDGLDHSAIERALRNERARSLAVVGVTLATEQRLDSTPRDARPGLGASAREAFVHIRRTGGSGRGQRAATDQRRHRLDELDLLVGILSAELGTVPRALLIAGIDRLALLARVNGVTS